MAQFIPLGTKTYTLTEHLPKARQQCRARPGYEHVASGECKVCETIAAGKANRSIQSVVLPELQRITSNTTGLEGFVCPPQRILEYDSRPTWEPREATPGERLVLCHCDLSRANIMLNEETMDVAAILDWENSGFYPKEFEQPVWTPTLEDYHATYQDHAQIQKDIKLITGTIRACSKLTKSSTWKAQIPSAENAIIAFTAFQGFYKGNELDD
ncbi:hypothetical protein GGS23DRAFT_600558 [Durotheca rogersii]|uniref:uncharacterized protein n=1 Tax=Durotheca rogersii TaxID=419775 RepID=UPI0022209489|nr:uncharacterized protein GGS23DRAFT_600558 [Durotheca rogersii]KAI5859269.1 hypothetical protein GGS23DRAFT_600558 [Durotheca rogersii]